jgi:hypothetical protein
MYLHSKYKRHKLVTEVRADKTFQLKTLEELATHDMKGIQRIQQPKFLGAN